LFEFAIVFLLSYANKKSNGCAILSKRLAMCTLQNKPGKLLDDFFVENE